MDSITIYENGRPAGTLTLRREGLYTLLEAALPPSPELTRLWLCGGGERADLGVLEPRAEGRVFRRRYTRADLSRLPAPMDCAVAAPADAARLAANAVGVPDLSAQPAICAAALHSPRISNLESQNSTPRPSSPRILKLESQNYLALPCALRHPRPGLRLVELDGQSYLLFRL